MVTRRDLTPGYQAVQPAHAMGEFSDKYPKVFKNWLRNHKNLVIVATENEKELLTLFEKAESLRLKCVAFKEPDIGNETTAIALEPCQASYKIVSCLPKALKEYA